MGSAGCGVAWLQPQSAAWIDRVRQNRRHHPRPPSGSAPLGSSFRPPTMILSDKLDRAGRPMPPCSSILGEARVTPVPKRRLLATHWGTYVAAYDGDVLVGLDPFDGDPAPSPIGRSIIG